MLTARAAGRSWPGGTQETDLSRTADRLLFLARATFRLLSPFGHPLGRQPTPTTRHTTGSGTSAVPARRSNGRRRHFYPSQLSSLRSPGSPCTRAGAIDSTELTGKTDKRDARLYRCTITILCSVTTARLLTHRRIPAPKGGSVETGLRNALGNNAVVSWS